jgi:hypothetical protein
MSIETLAQRNIDLLAGIENILNGVLPELSARANLTMTALREMARRPTPEEIGVVVKELERLTSITSVRDQLSAFHETAWDLNRQAKGSR